MTKIIKNFKLIDFKTAKFYYKHAQILRIDYKNIEKFQMFDILT